MQETQCRPTAVPLGEILAYKHPRLVERHARDQGVSLELATRRFEGLKQFLTVAATTPGRKVASPAIDEMWHSFLMFSKDYRTFCEEHLGRRIDHEPFEEPRPWIYPETRALAARLFGTLDPEIWPTEGKADCTSGCDE